jgi:hypothetical protein
MQHGSTRAIFLPAACASAAAFALYLTTAAHDIAGGAGIDSAKFGYMGRILGVPHPPGYPLYMLVGWLFSWLPVGSLMFRLSLLSAIGGAATIGLLAVLVQLLGCAPLVAVLVALIAAAGRVFWSQATIPEVYTLHTTLLIGSLVALVAWSQARRVKYLYLAALSFGLDLAHHTDIAVFAPAILVFVVLTDARVLRSAKTVATALAVALAPLSLYAYIVIRTRQGAEYVEARATDLPGLLSVVSGRQFGYLLFRGSAWDALRDRWPTIGRFFVQELGPLGCLLAVVGIGVLWRRDRAVGLLIALGAAGMMTFVFNYYPPDIEVFLLPVFLLGWLAVAMAVDALGRMSRSADWLARASLAIWLLWQTGANLPANDASHPSFEARLFTRLLERMPAHTAIVGDTIDVSHMVLYKVFSEPAIAAKRPTLVVPGEFGATRVFGFVRSTPELPVVDGAPDEIDRLVAERPAVYAFARMADQLRAQGFRLDPLRLPDRPLPEFLATLDRGLLVAGAVPGAAAQPMLRSLPTHAPGQSPFAAVGGSAPAPDRGQCYAVIGVAGARHGASESIGGIGRVEVRKGQPVGTTGGTASADVVVECGPGSASITMNGHEVSAADSAALLVSIGAGGEAVDQTMAAPAMAYQVPFEWRWQPIYRVAAPRECVRVEATLTDVSRPAAEGGLAIYLPPGARVRLYLGSDVPLRPRHGQFNHSAAPIAVNAEAKDEVGQPELATHWTRIDVGPSGTADGDIVDLVLGATARSGFASLDRAAPDARICAVTLGNFPVLAGALDGLERVIADEFRNELFGDGWHQVEQDAGGGFRWTAAADAHVLVPLAEPGSIQLSVRALVGPAADPSATIALRVNGRPLPPQAAARGWGTYQWAVGRDAWRAGVNDIVVHSSRLARASDGADPRLLGVAVREIDFKKLESR